MVTAINHHSPGLCFAYTRFIALRIFSSSALSTDAAGVDVAGDDDAIAARPPTPIPSVLPLPRVLLELLMAVVAAAAAIPKL